MVIKENVSIIKYRKRVPLSTALFTYSLLFLILFVCLGRHQMSSTEQAGSYTIFGVISACSIMWMAFNTYSICKNFPLIKQVKNILIYIWIPLVGIIANFLTFRQLFKEDKQRQKLHKGMNKNKEQLPVIVLLVEVTFVVVLAVWLFYACVGHIAKSVDVDGPTYYIIPGIVDVFFAPIQGFIDGAEIIIYLLVTGVFLQVINQSKALEAGIGDIVKKMKGKELIMIPIIMTLFSLGGIVFGMCEETLPFYAIIMPIALAAGFDAITGLFMVLFGAGLGVCASVINPFTIMTCIDASSSTIQLNISDGIVFRIMIYIIFTLIGIIFVMLYAKKVKNNPKKSLIYELKNVHSELFKFDSTIAPILTTKRKWILGIFFATFGFLVIGAIPWDTLLNIHTFENINSWLVNNFPFLSTSMGALGAWYLASFSLLFLVASVVVGAMTWSGINNFYKDCLIGAKDMLNVAFVIAVARGLSSILSGSGINTEITNGVASVLGINQVFGIIMMFILFILLSAFIPSTSGFAYSVFGPLAAPALFTANYSVSAGIASASVANGLVNLCSPTGGVFVISCEMTKVPLKNFYKAAWKLLLIIFACAVILLIISLYLPTSIVGK